ncbi:MAG: Glu-tRNA(Gln) amidotransferase GatDE subunit D [Thermoprotei archaeon ex4572_64]|nr:MAG: Glu-tRNA(Gln) amidotransferase GatDE subunit D [Thermoprotei archaeon ex4572_64]
MPYSERVVKFLNNFGISDFDEVEVTLNDGSILRGIILPRPEVGDVDVIIIKLPNGYNVGIHVDNVKEVKLLRKGEVPSFSVPIGETVREEVVKNLPKVRLLATGGTIMSKVDYKTGAVYPSFSLEELHMLYPEVESIAILELHNLMAVFSEDFNPQIWSEIAEAVYKAFLEGASGIVILHGTDTMHYTAAAMAFAIKGKPGPIVLVGSQRSSDRPSSDAFENLLAATLVAAKAPFAESVIAMHYTTNDGLIAIHRGTRVRKMHTSRRDAFISINAQPIAFIDIKKLEIKMNTSHYFTRSKIEDMEFHGKFDDKVALIKFYPGMSSEIIDFLVDKNYHGIVIEGTGFGHIGKQLLNSIKRAIEHEIPIVITSQTLFGRVNLNVYRRGVEMLKIGVIPAEDMLPEVAYVKLCWVLSKTRNMEEIRKLMLTPIAYELNPRTESQNYLTPLEIDKLVKSM